MINCTCHIATRPKAAEWRPYWHDESCPVFAARCECCDGKGEMTIKQGCGCCTEQENCEECNASGYASPQPGEQK